MADIVSTIVATPYLIVPLVAWLLRFTGLGEISWNEVTPGLVMILAADIIGKLSATFEVYAGHEMGTALLALFSMFEIVTRMLGLAIVGFVLLMDGILNWRVDWPF